MNEENKPHEGYQPEELAALYYLMSLWGVSLAATGFGLELLEEWTAASDEPFLLSIHAFLSSYVPASVLTSLGIWTLISTPIAGLLFTMAGGLAVKSRSTIVLSIGVLVLIAMAVPIKVWLEGLV